MERSSSSYKLLEHVKIKNKENLQQKTLIMRLVNVNVYTSKRHVHSRYNYIKNYNRINRINTFNNNSIRSKELFQIKFLNMIILIKKRYTAYRKRLSTQHLMTRFVLCSSFIFYWTEICEVQLIILKEVPQVE